ncbi:hypothetical protein KIPB_013010, partial [Kipferlia bialata]
HQSPGYLSALPMLSALTRMKKDLCTQREGRRMRQIIFINSWLLPTDVPAERGSVCGENITLEGCCDAAIARIVGVKVSFVHSLRQALEASSEGEASQGEAEILLETTATAREGVGGGPDVEVIGKYVTRREAESVDSRNRPDSFEGVGGDTCIPQVGALGTIGDTAQSGGRPSMIPVLPLGSVGGLLSGPAIEGPVLGPDNTVTTDGRDGASPTALAAGIDVSAHPPRELPLVAPPGTALEGESFASHLVSHYDRRTKCSLMKRMCMSKVTGRLLINVRDVKKLFCVSKRTVLEVESEYVAKTAENKAARGRAWNTTFGEYSSFVTTHGTWPVASTNAKLANWAVNQRRAFKSLFDVSKRTVQEIESGAVAKVAEDIAARAQAWNTAFGEMSSFVATHGTWPTTVTDAKLAKWAQRDKGET